MQEMFTQAEQAALHDQKDKGSLLDFQHSYSMAAARELYRLLQVSMI